MAVTPLAGSNYSREKTGIRKIALKYCVPMDGEDEPYELLDSYVPDETPLGLPLSPVRVSEKEDDGSWTLTLTFEGVPEDAEMVDDAEIDYAGVEDPIETFEGFEAMAKKYGAIFDGEKFDGWKRKIKDPVTGKVVKNPVYGQTHFLNDVAVLRVTFNEREYTSRYLGNICKIDTPRVPEGSEALRETEDGKQWIKRKVTVKFRGVWQYVIEWHQGYWTPDVYNPKR